MKKEIRTVVYDEQLKIEAYRFDGFVRSFPKHFHEYYVIGYIEAGQRVLSCNHQEYAIQPGHILLFNPGDSHACAQSDSGALDYRGFNISKEALLGLSEEIDDAREPPVFAPNVIFDGEIAGCMRTLHELVMSGSREPDKKEQHLAQGCRAYDEFIDKMGQTPERDLRYLGVALCGPKKKVNQLTGSMPLLR